MVLGNGNYFFKRNDFGENSSSTFKFLRNDKDFTDMTLACDDHHDIEAHKVILSAYSKFFDKILRQSKHPHPLIYLMGVKSRYLVSIVDCIYHGEVRIPQQDLKEFMLFATELKIKGLGEDGSDKRRNKA